jgi:hypothetical protein
MVYMFHQWEANVHEVLFQSAIYYININALQVTSLFKICKPSCHLGTVCENFSHCLTKKIFVVMGNLFYFQNMVHM